MDPPARPPIRDECQGLLDRLIELEIPDFPDMTPQQAREIFVFLRVAPDLLPDVGSVTEQTVPGPGGDDIAIRIYRPEAPETATADPNNPQGPPVLVWFHGGGWVLGDLETGDLPCRAMCRDADCVIVSVDYRLAPENPFPAAFDDCMAVTEWVLANTDELGVDATRVAVGGDSAGGNLAACVAIESTRRGLGLAHQHLVYPVIAPDYSTPSYSENAEGYFLTTRGMEWFWEQYTDAAHHADPRVVPTAVTGDAEGAKLLGQLPPAYVFTVGYDPLRDEGRCYGDILAAAGVPVEQTHIADVIHGVFAMTLSCGDEARTASVDALKRAFDS